MGGRVGGREPTADLHRPFGGGEGEAQASRPPRQPGTEEAQRDGYAGDIDNLSTPTNRIDEAGDSASSWPTPTAARSAQFTSAKAKEVSDAIYDRLAPDGGDTYNTFVHYDGPADRMVMRTTAPFSLTDPLVNDYPDMITVKPAPVGNVRMINVNSGKALDAAGCGTADGTGRAPCSHSSSADGY
ncbi:hypothetical protein AB0E08_45260 [Streptomyces sp. NPDC048281]|uniref:hypothetical protein n=1 Tax=Streptomyces sp. NPDC048281 TaxID=3154715 RepID=UPI00343630EC